MTDALSATARQLLERADYLRRTGYIPCPTCGDAAPIESENIGPHGPTFRFWCRSCRRGMIADYNREMQKARKELGQ